MNYVPHSGAERQEMLESLGMPTAEGLFSRIPKQARLNRPLNLPPGLSEQELLASLAGMAAQNTLYKTCLRGAGAYRHFIPAAVKRLVSRSEFVTAYTPYQAEMSQGILQAIFEYQSCICRLTGLDASNASCYDGAHAAAEAVLMTKERARGRAVLCEPLNPRTLAVIETYARGGGLSLTVIPHKGGVVDTDALAAKLGADVCAVFAETPNYYGQIPPMADIADLTRQNGAKLIASCNPISLAILPAPSEYGADIAVGEGQPLGLPLSYGGPYLGFIACKADMTRKLPGRIVGQTTDGQGRRAFVLTLQAREQHIRREKASSSICSNEALCALTAAVFLSALGPEGLREMAENSASKARYLLDGLRAGGWGLVYGGDFFHEFVTTCPVDFKTLETALAAEGILAGLPVEGGVLWCVTESVTKGELDKCLQVIDRLGAASPAVIARSEATKQSTILPTKTR